MPAPALPPSLPRQRNRGGIAHITGGGNNSGAPAVLFLHGVGLSADCWQAQIHALQPHCRVFALDLPGHGESAPLAADSAEIGDFAAKIADFIESEIDTAVMLVGHSLGALLALHLAAALPQRVHSAVLLSTVYQRSPAAQQAVEERARTLHTADAATRAALIDTTLARWFGNPPLPDWQDAEAACRHWLQCTPAPAYAAAYRAFAAAGAEAAPLATLRQPLLYLTGAEDAHSTPQMTHALAACSPAARAEVLPAHAHMLQLTAPAQVSALLQGWLGEQRHAA